MRGKFVERRLEREAVVARERLEPAAVPCGFRVVRCDAAFLEGFRAVRHDEIRIELERHPEPGADRTGAERVVEREQPGLELGDADAAVRAGVFLRKELPGAGAVPVLVSEHHDAAVGHLERGLYRLGEPLLRIGREHERSLHVDRVFRFFSSSISSSSRQARRLSSPGETGLLASEHALVFAFLRGSPERARSAVNLGYERPCRDLVDRLLTDLAADPAVRPPDRANNSLK